MARRKNKHSLTIARHRTSISLEDEFWSALADAARDEGKSIASLVGEIDQRRGAGAGDSSLSAAIRLYVLRRMRAGRPGA
ncbi:ribbon-helix-helix domain-containing protein [Methyloceanibacter sp.]|uniref:ribbon-helix-helix domain-containing protein n=1 Tax=Methyloceanibacter sp. TaxID=1965321 RepID=UPI002D5D16DF|nr:ribbon-helix-helix domain-containing protein [Methyloceanibacter sp.]HZP10712.1 ribbon-helix-helix domain-containing protein [Methyloceanibacter sp.]